MPAVVPNRLIRIYSSTPRKISSSNNTDFTFHQIPFKITLNVRSGFNCHRCLANSILKKNSEEQNSAVMERNNIKSKPLFFVGDNPKTDKFRFSITQIITHEIIS